MITFVVVGMLTAATALVSDLADATTQTTTARLSPIADTYVTSGNPTANFGGANQVQASDMPGHQKISFLRFQVPALTNNTIVEAHLLLQRSAHHLSAEVSANAVTYSDWAESALTYDSAPVVGKSLDRVKTDSSTSTISLDVADAVRAGADVTIALTSPSTDNFAAFRSKEWGQGAPVLELTLLPSGGAAPVPAPETSSTPVPTSSVPSTSAAPSTNPETSSSPVPPATSPAPPATTPAPPPSSAPPAAGCVSSPTGIPSSGAYLGAAVSGTPTLAGLEQQVGRPIAIHRNYFSADQVDYAISSVKADLAAGRLPWISFKMPLSWADMAAGKGDAWAVDLTNKLAQVGGPVWLAFHHEPEGDGSLPDWVAMQRHLAPIVHARAKNVAYTVIYTGWDVLFAGPQYALDSLWPGDQYVDILGIDMYNDYGSNRNGNPNIPMLDPMKYYGILGPWARAHHVSWAIGEIGYTNSAAAVNPNWLATAYHDLQSEGGIALTYFDSSLNSIADWTLTDPAKMNAFRSLMPQSVRLSGAPPSGGPGPVTPGLADGYYRTNPGGIVYKVLSNQRWRVSAGTWGRLRGTHVAHPITWTTMSKLRLRGVI